jgi:hypothetical protein
MRLILISALLIISALIAAGAMIFWWFSPAATLARAQQHWESRTFTDYRMVGHFFCRYDALIQNEQVVETFDSDCSRGIYPVSEQFLSIQQMLSNRSCGFNDCVCGGRGVIEVQYNPQWGYPERILYEISPEHRWRTIEYWQARLQGKANCPYAFEMAMEMRVDSLTPLP